MFASELYNYMMAYVWLVTLHPWAFPGDAIMENERLGQEANGAILRGCHLPQEATSLIGDPQQPNVEPSGGVEVGHLWHGKQVVDIVLRRNGEDGINELVRRFRESFVEALKPKFLPEFWSTVHYAPREFGKHSIYGGNGTVEDPGAAQGQPSSPQV